MKEINPGITGKAEMTADSASLAVNVGSGSLAVFATPSMIALMEKAACACVAQYLENDETTVGTELCVKHTSATPSGMNIFAEAQLTEINGRELTFTVRASDDTGLIGSGTHKRFLVYGERFMAKTLEKNN